MRHMRRRAPLLAALTLAAALGACSDPIVGQWVDRDGSQTLEFLESGTVIASNGGAGEWQKAHEGYVISFTLLGAGFSQRAEVEDYGSLLLYDARGSNFECFFKYRRNSDGSRTKTTVSSSATLRRCQL